MAHQKLTNGLSELGAFADTGRCCLRVHWLHARRAAGHSMIDPGTPTLSAVVAEARGLTQQQVRERLQDGRSNAADKVTSRSVGDILKANVLTRFNALLERCCSSS